MWLYAPQGYVGASASLEIGYAHALGIPVFTDIQPADPVMASMVQVVASVDDAIELAVTSSIADPGRPLRALQVYYAAIAERRGYANESAQDTMLLLTEELGELARAVRKNVGLVREGGYGHEDVGEEIADVQLYLVHLANILGADIAKSVTDKERINDQRARRRGRQSMRQMA
ncbi:MAG: MazG nucleotide pyrophosphohydrolase domain-containing protein [Candidatus Dormibacteraceae bacterium]